MSTTRTKTARSSTAAAPRPPSTAAAGGFIETSSADAYATSEADVQALVASAAVLDATGASIECPATGENGADAESKASGGGAVSLKFMLAEATVDGTIAANFDGDVVGASSVTVEADGVNDANADVSRHGWGRVQL